MLNNRENEERKIRLLDRIERNKLKTSIPRMLEVNDTVGAYCGAGKNAEIPSRQHFSC